MYEEKGLKLSLFLTVWLKTFVLAKTDHTILQRIPSGYGRSFDELRITAVGDLRSKTGAV